MFSQRSTRLVFAFLSTTFFILVAIYPASTKAAVIQPRSISISSALPSAVATHSFQFTIPTTTNLGSIVLQYCSNSPLPSFACVAPAGMDISSASLSSQSGNNGFSIDSGNSTANKIVLTRPAIPGLIIPSSYVFSNVTNPSTPGQSVFVRLSTHASTDGSGASNDTGAVAFSIASPFEIGAFVPPFLKLCVGITVSPDCTSQSGDSIDLGVLSSNSPRSGQSQFSTATNDPSGYVIYSLGTTMTSGNNIISPLTSLSPSFPGTGQFGINLRANLIPAVGQDPVGTGSATPTPNYNVPNHYIFNSGDSIAIASLPSDYNRMTVSYLANIASKQLPGIYSTTITYVATVQF